MMHCRSLVAYALVAAFAGIACAPAALRAQTTVAAPSPAPSATASGTPIPYPAYGTPAPDVAAQVAKPGVPTTISLTQAIDIAVLQSPAFASERAQYRAILARYQSEREAVFPNLAGSASVQRQYGGTATRGFGGVTSTPLPGASPGPAVLSGPFTTISGQIALTQLIYDGGRVIAAIRSAKESNAAGLDTLIRQLQTLGYTVAQAYYGVLQADATVSSDASLVRQFETQERNVTAQVRAGAAARSDLAAAQFQTAQARGALVTAQGLQIAAQSTFATTLGLDADALVRPQTSGGTTPRTLGYGAALSTALAARPDYMAAEHTVESAKENVRYAKLARFPALNANASTGYSESLPTTTPKLESGQSLGATLTIPIFDQGLTNYNVALAASQLDQATAGLFSTKLTVESDVRGALANIISARASLVQAQAELRAAQVNLDAFQARYRVGAATITDLVTAEANLATAQRDNVTAVYNERVAEERYLFALGTSDLRL
ncbi:MAG: TolC family protein [Candidatus Eremiobacteraeota bacterium]|nr:TolC family protein [Candidatus Eremiobacteraeota bacterium]